MSIILPLIGYNVGTTMNSSQVLTFLFTDIEGSTQLWERFPDAMPAALAKHDQLVRSAIEQNGGSVFKTVGDSFCAVFESASDAAHAVLQAQLALQAETWDDRFLIKARMALHTGEAHARDDDYFGNTLNRCARLLAVGHGGQILASSATETLLRDHLPEGATLKSLGSHRLKDLNQPEVIYQLVHAQLIEEFPTLRGLGSFPNNLPVQLTSFIGRERDIAEIKESLASKRLITLTGSGGVGKTRLTLQVAAEMLEQFPDGTWFVELAPVSDPALVPQVIASILHLHEEPQRPIADTLVNYLRSKTLLLVLDNCEHVLDACIRLCDAILHQCPQVRILASSREALGIVGEQSYRVQSLTLPDPRHLDSAQLAQTLESYEAARLFVERAMLSLPDFQVTESNAAAIAQICHRLDGIPLAIELAAARVKAMSVEQLLARLQDRFRLLTGGSRTALPRQQTLRAAIDWSYALLSDQEKTLLRRLSVFSGGWTLEAAEKVCSDDADIPLPPAP